MPASKVTTAPKPATHTPGPWYAKDCYIFAENDDYPPVVAQCSLMAFEDEEAAANVHLIAAAPDLLARLRDANVIIEKALAVMTNEQKRAWGELVDRVDLDGTGVTRRDHRDAAIAKAEGRS